MNTAKTYYVIGLMSGSSLDGLDIVYCKIDMSHTYTFEIIHAHTYAYSHEIKKLLTNILPNSGNTYLEESKLFALLCAEYIQQFINTHHIAVIDFVSSHGHTVYHFPDRGKTCQIGDGKILSEKIKLPVIWNFRQADIDAGGQGAPLVPVTDELFFADYHACLNIGGIANISFKIDGERIGFDICGANQLLNYCAQELHMEFDNAGAIAKSGGVNSVLLSQLNTNSYFELPYPKSLDNNWVKNNFIKPIEQAFLSTADKLATATEHIAMQIASVIMLHRIENAIDKKNYNILVTGGGAYNAFLIERIEALTGSKLPLPAENIIQYKEALAMCVMGLLRWENKPNFIPSVTGASYAVCGGIIS